MIDLLSILLSCWILSLTLICFVLDTSDDGSVNFCLSIQSEPDLKLSRVQSGSTETGDDDEYFVLGESYRFQCEISGNPEPDHVTWIACDESGNVCNDTKEFSENVRKTKIFSSKIIRIILR